MFHSFKVVQPSSATHERVTQVTLAVELIVVWVTSHSHAKGQVEVLVGGVTTAQTAGARAQRGQAHRAPAHQGTPVWHLPKLSVELMVLQFVILADVVDSGTGIADVTPGLAAVVDVCVGTGGKVRLQVDPGSHVRV